MLLLFFHGNRSLRSSIAIFWKHKNAGNLKPILNSTVFALVPIHSSLLFTTTRKQLSPHCLIPTIHVSNLLRVYLVILTFWGFTTSGTRKKLRDIYSNMANNMTICKCFQIIITTVENAWNKDSKGVVTY